MRLSRFAGPATPAVVARFAALAIVAFSVTGCGSMIADIPVVGLPADAPPRKERGAFLPVHDIPAQRDTAKMETAEQARIRAELSAARDKQAAAAAAATK